MIPGMHKRAKLEGRSSDRPVSFDVDVYTVVGKYVLTNVIKLHMSITGKR